MFGAQGVTDQRHARGMRIAERRTRVRLAASKQAKAPLALPCIRPGRAMRALHGSLEQAVEGSCVRLHAAVLVHVYMNSNTVSPMVSHAVGRPRTSLRNALHTKCVCNTYISARATNNTR